MLNSRDIASIVVLGRMAKNSGSHAEIDSFTRWACGIPFEEIKQRAGAEPYFSIDNPSAVTVTTDFSTIFHLACYAYSLEEAVVYNVLIGDTEGRYYSYHSGPFWTYAEASSKADAIGHWSRVETKSVARWKLCL